MSFERRSPLWVSSFVVGMDFAGPDLLSSPSNSQDEMVPSTATQQPFPWKAKPVDEVGDIQRDFVIGYMNENHPEFGRTSVTTFRTIGTEMAQANHRCACWW
jgi:hypothetical protein